MKRVLLICYLSIMLSLTLAFAFDSWHNYDEPVIQYEHTISVIYQDDYDQLILDGWVLNDTLVIYTDTVYKLTYTDLDTNVSILYVKVVTVP
jgi:hypothetical protein